MLSTKKKSWFLLYCNYYQNTIFISTIYLILYLFFFCFLSIFSQNCQSSSDISRLLTFGCIVNSAYLQWSVLIYFGFPLHEFYPVPVAFRAYIYEEYWEDKHSELRTWALEQDCFNLNLPQLLTRSLTLEWLFSLSMPQFPYLSSMNNVPTLLFFCCCCFEAKRN